MKEWDKITVSLDADGMWGFYTSEGYDFSTTPYKQIPGRQVFKQRWHGARDFTEDGLAAVSNGRRWGFINLKGELVIPYQWKDCLAFSEGVCAVNEVRDEWWIIDTKGKKLAKFDGVAPLDDFSEGLCCVRDDRGKEGFANKEGRVVIPCQWDEVALFSEGLAGVKNDAGLWGFINSQGQIVIPNKWKEITDCFFEGECGVRNFEDEEWQHIDTRGNILKKTTQSTAAKSEPPFNSLNDIFSFTNERPYNLFSFTNFKNLFCISEVCNDSLLAIILGGIGILLLVLSPITYYDAYNTETAYQMFSLNWWVSSLGGIHTYDLFLPLIVALVFMKPLLKPFRRQPNYSNPDDDDWFFGRVILPVFVVLSIFLFAYFFVSLWLLPVVALCFSFVAGNFSGKKFGLTKQRMWALTVYLLLIMAPLRLIYIPLFAINSSSIVESRNIVIMKVQKTSVQFNYRYMEMNYYFIVNVDEGIPYRLRIGKKGFDSIRNGKTSWAMIKVGKGCLGFSVIKRYKLMEERGMGTHMTGFSGLIWELCSVVGLVDDLPRPAGDLHSLGVLAYERVDMAHALFLQHLVHGDEDARLLHVAKAVVDGGSEELHRGREAHVGVH